ncbi:unnamed protein product, partial [Tilletia laevis]
MTSYPPPSGPPPAFDSSAPEAQGQGQGYPTHNPYAPTPHGYDYAPDDVNNHAPTSGGWGLGGGGSGGGRRKTRAGTTTPGLSRFNALVQRSPLRSVLIFTCFLSGVYLAVGAYSQFRALGRAAEPARLKVFDGVQGGLFGVAAGIEAFGVYAAVKAEYRLARIYSLASCVSLACALAGELLGIINHFISHTLILDACTKRNTGRIDPSWDNGWWGSSNYYDADDFPAVSAMNGTANGTVVYTEADARAWCEALYRRYTPWLIIWLIATAFVGAIFVVISFAFVRQIEDPSAVGRGRTRVAPSAQYSRNAGAGAGGGGGGAQMPELRYDSYPMGDQPHSGGAGAGAGGYGYGRRSTDSDYAWDSRDAKSPTYDPYSYGNFDQHDDERDAEATTTNARDGGGQKKGGGADVDANTLVGEEDRKDKFGGGRDGDGDEDGE